jgi:hypothetical protein
MADDSMKPWGKFSLSADEDLDVEIKAAEVENIVTRGKFCIVGKLVADRYVSKETIRKELFRWWKLSKAPNFKVLGDNLFLIEFEDAKDKKRVLEGRPWVFEGNLFLVEDFDGRIAPSAIPFKKAFFWVRMKNLPLACMGRDVGFKIGSSVGEVEEVDADKDGIGWGEFLRVKILIDLSKPLPRGRKLKFEGESTWVSFQYERLPRFCFHCGVISHGHEGCQKRSVLRNHENTTEYGMWLKAESPTRRPEKIQGRGHSFQYGRDEDLHRRERVGRRETRYDSRRRSPTDDELDGMNDRYGEEGQNWDAGKPRKESRYDAEPGRKSIVRGSRNLVETEKEKSFDEGTKSGEKIWRVKNAEKGKDTAFSNDEAIKKAFPFQGTKSKEQQAIDERGTFRFGESISEKTKEGLIKGKLSRRGQGGASRTARANQKPDETKKLVGQAGPKVTEIAALLAKHLQAHEDQPPSKKRQREDYADDAGLEGGTLYGGSLSSEWKKKGGDVEPQVEKSTNGSAAAGNQPRRSL